MADKKLEYYTESEFIDFINRIRNVDFPSEADHSSAMYEFGQLIEHPDKWDLIYRPKPGADNSTKGIIETIKVWRAANGKPGFKTG
ncbi:bacteriocin immunity protein [Pseudocitrobacter sp. RIT415]|uniref:bacteriocin immunity protein n=1 Tax=Pseudocitrobacter sp. RIT415 TaxID=2202163 RepID=UPI000D34EA16|nr:bacteriocin immunity protein [Pseudocitrobacter sp. RIT 415]RAU45275.1 bacteriocin immunity protein [Pseudocitrobacter sp. RIT 415]